MCMYYPYACTYKLSHTDFGLMTPLKTQDSTSKLMRFSEKIGVICSFIAAFICFLKEKSLVIETSGYL